MNQQEVVVFDLRDPATRKHLSTVPIHEALVENLSQAASADRGGGGTQEGVLRPFLILVIDRATQIVDSAEILAKLLAQPAEVRLTALIEHDADFLSAKVSLPSALDSDKARVVWVSHPAGTAWRAGVGLADGIGHWPQDPGGAHAFDVLVDSLRLPEVFRAVHDATDQSPSRVFSLALKRTVLGLDASETIGIFLDEAGRTLVGDGSIDPSLPEPHFWELPPALTGKITDDSVLSERDGSVGWMAQEAIRHADRFESIVGKRLGPIQTLARSKKDYLAAPRSSAEGFEALTTASHELLRQIDATDGIDQAEHGLVRRFGVNMHARIERPDLMLVADQLLEALEADLSLGHSVEPFLQRLESDLVDVNPTESDQVRERIEDLVPTESLEKLAAAGASFPQGWWTKLLGFDLRRIWSSPAFLIGLVGLVAVLALGFLSSRANGGSGLAFLDECDSSVCLAVRGVIGWNGWATLSVFCLVAIPTIVLAGLYAAFRARAEIPRWGRALQTRNISTASVAIRREIADVVVNNWILGPYRKRAHYMLEAAHTTVRSVQSSLADALLDRPATGETDRLNDQLVNPAVEEHLLLKAGTPLLRRFRDVTNVVRADILQLVAQNVRSFWPLLQASDHDKLPVELRDRVVAAVGRYVDTVHSGRLLSPDAAQGSVGIEQREAVLAKLWNDGDLTASTVEHVVSTRARSVLLQMIRMEDLVLVEQTEGDSLVVRHVPEIARRQAEVAIGGLGVSSEMTYTKDLTTAGVIRLTPLRDGIVMYVEALAAA